jgi:hypothetical protein
MGVVFRVEGVLTRSITTSMLIFPIPSLLPPLPCLIIKPTNNCYVLERGGGVRKMSVIVVVQGCWHNAGTLDLNKHASFPTPPK